MKCSSASASFPGGLPLSFGVILIVIMAGTYLTTLLAAWAGLAVWAMSHDMAPTSWVTGGLCAIGLYFLAAGSFRRPDDAQPIPE